MVLVTTYSHLCKQVDDEDDDDSPGTLRPFHAVRAIGLACEAGHKAAQKKGLGALSVADVSQVKVVGTLRVKEDERWRSLRSCTLQLRPTDAAFCRTLVQKQRSVLADLRMNLWYVDINMKGGKGAFDLLADFSSEKNWGISGVIWIELKVYGASVFDKSVEKAQKVLVKTLERERQKDGNLGGVLLFAAKVEKQGSSWAILDLLGTLRATGDGEWQNVVGGVKRVARGQSPSKPPLSQVWKGMEWVTSASGQKVGLLKHFLAALGVKDQHPGQRASTFNKLLRQAGHSGRVREEKVENHCGRKPWVAQKDTFRALYPFL
jgi:hypothetical protein